MPSATVRLLANRRVMALHLCTCFGHSNHAIGLTFLDGFPNWRSALSSILLRPPDGGHMPMAILLRVRSPTRRLSGRDRELRPSWLPLASGPAYGGCPPGSLLRRSTFGRFLIRPVNPSSNFRTTDPVQHHQRRARMHVNA
jgi:hypothetical protein